MQLTLSANNLALEFEAVKIAATFAGRPASEERNPK